MNMDAMLSRAKSISQRQSYIRLEDGVTKVRFVGTPGVELPYVEIYKHFLIIRVLFFNNFFISSNCPECSFE